ncbi:ABC transporter permease [Facklamia sp. 7083-14-GEN3]|uniref:ABC transporter permease n=1 Tax=Facklamia sp. 7083-14-GEN3 TaxID=2973478 RepID=UPI00215BDDB5|nr:ABC transporter permease [Facklamia sp. 7083-14-GEN3]MCR8969382.1 ABC transporter permease [Facklamia sp. 7083-14-GEN3]
MFKRIGLIFMRDLKVNLKDALSLYILLIPILFGIAINLFSPSINDTTVNLALIEGENPEQVEYFQKFAKVEIFKNEDQINDRIKKRDTIIGVLPDKESYYLLTQGNESDSAVDYAKLLLTFFELGVTMEDSRSQLVDYNRKIPPLKKTLANISILTVSILGGMLIALNIIEEKTDKTLSAINLTPTTSTTFILGKSMIGIFLAIFGALTLILITGFTAINLIQLILVVFVTSLLSILVGFIQGLNNNDVIGAASSIKLLFLPLVAAVIAIELLNDQWQKFFYWDPFYWAYKANDLVLSQTDSWGQVLLYSAITFIICALVYSFLAPQIKKKLQ